MTMAKDTNPSLSTTRVGISDDAHPSMLRLLLSIPLVMITVAPLLMSRAARETATP
jgi:hypothetical protein